MAPGTAAPISAALRNDSERRRPERARIRKLSSPDDNLPPSHPNEDNDLKRVRAYRAHLDGQSLRIVRGDMHRHTDESWDGNRDGSLDDAYRYALDAAGFDYLGVCDHKGDVEDPAGYSWWRIQKAVDLYTITGRFTPLYSYERSVEWPNGHRNVFFTLAWPPDSRHTVNGGER